MKIKMLEMAAINSMKNIVYCCFSWHYKILLADAQRKNHTKHEMGLHI